MKKILKKILIPFLKNEVVGQKINQLSTFIWKVKYQKDLAVRKNTEAYITDFTAGLFRHKKVLHGPFKGLVYPVLRSVNSSLYAKLLGSYEKELHGILEDILNAEYRQVLNIGCAEGYYAVGLALKLPKAIVYAYDIDKEAREMTLEMAKANHVDSRLVIASDCTPETLKNFSFVSKTLIVCDAEGYEQFLFNETVKENLRNVDILIETHDSININISTNLVKLFSPTHEVQIFQSVSDTIKAKYYNYPELADMDLLGKYRIFQEGRRFTDEWLWMKALPV